MSPIPLVLALASLWALLRFWLVPLSTTRWSASDIGGKITKAGSLVVFEKLRDLAGMGALAVGLVTVFVQIADLIGGADVLWPKSAIKSTGALYETAKKLSENYGVGLVVIGLIGSAAALAWAARSAKRRVVRAWQEKAASTYEQLLSNPAALDAARQNAEYQPFFEKIDEALDALSSEDDPAAPDPSRAAKQDVLTDALSALAISIAAKTVDFSGAASDDDEPANPPRGFWQHALRVLSSRQLGKDLGLVRRPLALTVTALLFVSLIGWAAEPMANSLRLAVNNLRMQAAHRDAQQNLQQALSRLPPPSPQSQRQSSALPSNAAQQAAQLMARNIVQELTRTSFVSSSASNAKDEVDRSELVRAVLNEQTSDPAAPYSDVRQAAADAVVSARKTSSDVEDHIRKRVEPVFERMRESDPNKLASLLAHLEARYSTPMSVADAQGKLTETMLNQVFSAAKFQAETALDKAAGDLAKDVGKKAVETWVNAQTDRFLAQVLSDSALPEVERAMFEVRKPNREMIAGLRKTDTSAWRPSPSMAKEARMGSSVADFAADAVNDNTLRRSLGGYDELFPRAGQVIADAAAPAVDGAANAAFAEARAITFDVAASSFRVRGVIIGRRLGGKPLDVTDIRWRVLPPARAGKATRIAVDLLVAGPAPSTAQWRTAGAYDAGVLNQALRYAADRRVVATTIVAGDGRAIQRETSLHPTLSNTALGCRVIAVDRVIDTLSFRNPPPQLGQFASDRINMAAWLEVAGLAEAAAQERSCPVQELTTIVKKSDLRSVHFSPAMRQSLETFMTQRVRATPGSDALVREVDHCAGGPAKDLPACLCAQTHSTSLPERYWFPEDHTSQVRERTATLTPDLSWLRPSPSGLENFEFVTHTTFAVHNRDKQEPDEATATTMSFPSSQLAVLRQEIARRLPEFVATDLNESSVDDLMRPLEEFVLAQRLARAALDGQLGRDFPIVKLVTLERATRPFVRRQPTLRWEPANPRGFLDGLKQKDPDAAEAFRQAVADEADRRQHHKPMCAPVSG